MKFSLLNSAWACLLFPLSAFASPEWNSETLTGDWHGTRTRMSKAGANLHITYKGDVLSVLSGGIENGTKYLDQWDFKLILDGEKLWGIPGSSGLIHIISNHGSKFNALNVGTAQGIDNIEVAATTSKVFQAWLQQTFYHDKVSILAGLYDLNSEFYVTDSSTLFLHPTFGMASDLGQTGVNGPSIFPTTSFGIRVKYQPTPKFYAQAVVLDGVPGDPNNPYGTHIQFNKGDGALDVAEFGWEPQADKADANLIDKYAFGMWRYTAHFDDLVDTNSSGQPEKRVNRGAYVLAEKTLTQEKDDSSQGLTGFIRYGVASPDINRFDRALGVGINYRGLIPGRNEDVFGFAIAAEHNSAKHRQSVSNAGGTEPSSESAYELTYRAQIRPWLAIQPELQFIENHGEPAIKDVWVGGVRIEIEL